MATANKVRLSENQATLEIVVGGTNEIFKYTDGSLTAQRGNIKVTTKSLANGGVSQSKDYGDYKGKVTFELPNNEQAIELSIALNDALITNQSVVIRVTYNDIGYQDVYENMGIMNNIDFPVGADKTVTFEFEGDAGSRNKI